MYSVPLRTSGPNETESGEEALAAKADWATTPPVIVSHGPLVPSHWYVNSSLKPRPVPNVPALSTSAFMVMVSPILYVPVRTRFSLTKFDAEQVVGAVPAVAPEKDDVPALFTAATK
jgi:hypothetical protein